MGLTTPAGRSGGGDKQKRRNEIMDATKAETIRHIVDEKGWSGLREQHPELYKEILQERVAAREWLDAEFRSC